MREREFALLVGILILTLAAIWVDLPNNPGLHISLGPIRMDREINLYQGLDLRGGTQVLLEADVSEAVDREAMLAAKAIIERRVDSLGVMEPLIHLQGTRRISVELPEVEDLEVAVEAVSERGLLEFVDAGTTPLSAGTIITTTFEEEGVPAVITPTVTITPTLPITPTEPTPAATERVFRTVMTNEHLQGTMIRQNEYGGLDILFGFTEEGGRIFADFTSQNVNEYLAIAMDKEIISSPVIREPMPAGGGVQISTEKRFTPAEARKMSIQLKHGALPLPLKVIEHRAVGPTLGQDSVRKSILAGGIGLALAALFLLITYRLPGLLALLALSMYTAIVFALFKLIPVVLTMSGMAGFLLSLGMAVDANLLIFERVKEALRVGKTLGAAVESGFARAWPSIRDPNVSTLIICAILFWLGSQFGASVVKGFALTLGIGVLVSMFTATVVTRTFLRVTQMLLPADRATHGERRLRFLFGY
ncbi:MAG TPA: protein translocase subunit SecD [Anaerolineae bacterium]|nr:protein translocase subunit SecD [Anaerolineae bacterium]